jgi:membrane protease YdiL (CAAX protease family)
VLGGLAFLSGALASGGLPGVYGFALGGATTSAALTCFALAGARFAGGGFREALGLDAWPRSLGPAGVAIAALGMLGLSQGLDALLGVLDLREQSVLELFDRTLRGAEGLAVAAALLGLALAPAIGEELFFRGMMLQRLRRTRGPRIALLASAVLFGAIHMDLAQGSAAVFLGLYLGALTLATGHVWTAVLCHAVNNAVAIASVLVEGAWWAHAASGAIAVLGAAALIVTLLRLGRLLPAALRPGDDESEPGARRDAKKAPPDPRGNC